MLYIYTDDAMKSIMILYAVQFKSRSVVQGMKGFSLYADIASV